MRAKTKFKKTPIGEIPEDWKVLKLGDLFDFQRGYSYRKNDISEKPTKLRFITINDFEKEGGLKKNTKKIYLREDLKIDKKYFIEGSALFIANTDMSKGLIIGAPLLISQQKGKGQIVFSMDLTRLIPRKRNISLEYIFYLLLSPSMRMTMKAFAQGTNVLHLNHTLVRDLKIPLPPLEEQKQIAEILRTVDEAIEKTDLAIEKTERLKKGLMQRLLTKGIKHKRFKKTEIGEIPEEWKVTTIGKECIVGTGGTPSRNNPEYFGGRIPWVKSTEVDYNIIEHTEETLTELGLKNSNAKIYPAGTLIIAMYGQGATRGKCAILGIDAAINQACAAVVPKDKNRVHIPYLYYWCQFRYNHIRRLGQGANQSNLNLSLIRSIKFPLPPLEEQKQIAEILMTVDKKLELLRKRKEKLERIKKGLMNDLLTGRRRVKV